MQPGPPHTTSLVHLSCNTHPRPPVTRAVFHSKGGKRSASVWQPPVGCRGSSVATGQQLALQCLKTGKRRVRRCARQTRGLTLHCHRQNLLQPKKNETPTCDIHATTAEATGRYLPCRRIRISLRCRGVRLLVYLFI